ncbi:hypothetical protein ACLMAL_21180 [Nocardia sp. CWNU-33]|uniref:hypothetical protein n=1 Tax=Nocardia sp. CWNU-33 TaxID=3392117 RepID=UPI00398EF163
MSSLSDLSPTERQLVAGKAVDDLGSDRDDHILLQVRCGRSHHVATVFDTALGAVYESLVAPHAHGQRDFIDEAHHAGRHGTRYTDILRGDRFSDDLVPANCECGMHELSRTELGHAIDAHRHMIQLT